MGGRGIHCITVVLLQQQQAFFLYSKNTPYRCKITRLKAKVLLLTFLQDNFPPCKDPFER